MKKILVSLFERGNDLLFRIVFPFLAVGALWCAGAFFRAFDAPAWAAATATAATVALLVLSISLRRAAWALVIVELSALAAFLCIAPGERFRNTAWQKPWARTLEAVRLPDGRYELRNVRDFRYRSEHDYDVRYRTFTVDPERIASVDAALSHWDDLEGVAHSMLGLNFDDGTTVVISLETRLPEGVAQNAVDGFYHRYALAMLGGTPEDLYGLRTDHRGETLYIYRVDADKKYMRALTVSLLERARELHAAPEYYNSLFRNCSTGLLPMLPRSDELLPSDLRLILNGMMDHLLFEQKLIVRREGESFGSLRARSLAPGRCSGKGAPHERYRGESGARWLKER